MKIIETSIPDVKIIEPDVFGDARGYFSEVYSKERYEEFGISANFIQDNESFSQIGTLRGLHYQKSPYTQAKLVRVATGAVFDVAVDIRKNSATFGEFVCVELSAENHRQLYIPRGFAHGFLVLKPNTIFSYKCDNFYNPQADSGISFCDPVLNIPWQKLDVPYLLSEKDKNHPLLGEIFPWEP